MTHHAATAAIPHERARRAGQGVRAGAHHSRQTLGERRYGRKRADATSRNNHQISKMPHGRSFPFHLIDAGLIGSGRLSCWAGITAILRPAAPGPIGIDRCCLENWYLVLLAWVALSVPVALLVARFLARTIRAGDVNSDWMTGHWKRLGQENPSLSRTV